MMEAVRPAFTDVLYSHRDQSRFRVAVEVGNRVADMVDHRFGLRPRCGTRGFADAVGSHGR